MSVVFVAFSLAFSCQKSLTCIRCLNHLYGFLGIDLLTCVACFDNVCVYILIAQKKGEEKKRMQFNFIVYF